MKKKTIILLILLSVLLLLSIFLFFKYKYEKFESDYNLVNCNKYKYLCSNNKIVSNQYESYPLLRGVNIQTDNILEKNRKNRKNRKINNIFEKNRKFRNIFNIFKKNRKK
jgi:hypothetical protein